MENSKAKLHLFSLGFREALDVLQVLGVLGQDVLHGVVAACFHFIDVWHPVSTQNGGLR